MIVGMAPPAILLLTLVVYHTYLIFTNGTTQENVRDKYIQWDGNPYNIGTASKANFNYFFKKQDTLIFNNKDELVLEMINNQHIKDGKLIHMIEIEEEEYS